ncbi:MAG: Flp pilus assembly complex ATPase component TadA [Acidobacteria bacterium]|nr:Flp pilus assembly complex ATPase component TadA [Acidobacteriota bacterium]
MASVTDPTRDPSASGKAAIADTHRIGDVLVEDGAITAEQLSKLLRVQARLEDHKPIGQLAIELGMLTRARLEEALRKHRRGLSIEGILVERGVIRAEQVAAARDALKGSSSDVARHLVDIGAVSERVYLLAYCERHGMSFIDVEPGLVDRSLLKKVSIKYLSRHRLVPLSVKDGRLNVVISDVGQSELAAELERLYGVPITFWVSERHKIAATLSALENETAEGRVATNRRIEYRNVAPGVTDDAGGAAEIVESVILRAIRDRASDIHFEPDPSRLRIRNRIDGQLIPVAEYPATLSAAIISRVKVLAEADIAEHRVHQQGRIYIRCDGEDIDLRASFYVTVAGENAVLRILRKGSTLVGLEEMGFSPATLTTFIQDVLEPNSGMLLVTGPTGSGKTTTLYASLQRLVDSSSKVITCEDPVEYVVDGITQCSVSDRPGMSFVDSLKSIVRQDPDIILVGEIRDAESANMAIHSALTGHKVLTTFHTEDTVGALVRLIQMDIEPFLISSTITAIVGQRLVRRQCAHCRVDYTPTAMEVRALGLSRDELGGFSLTKGRGCPACHYTGYHGRVGVYELLVMNDLLRDTILQKPAAHEIRRVAQEAPDFVSLQEDGVAKALRGETTLSEIAANCPRRPMMRPLRQLMEMCA